MNTKITQEQIESYRTNGFLLVENFLNETELSFWREAVTEAVEQRGGKKMPGSNIEVGKDDGINKDTDYFFELRILEDEITKDVSLMVTDFAFEEDFDEVKLLWESQISDLKHVIGSV